MKLRGLLFSFVFLTGISAAQTGKCNVDNYKAVTGMTAEQSGNDVILTWQGESNE